ncbi:MAG: dihydroorotase [Alphaproteobacteria bacterium]|jgi:dihydroorotase|nr:dihydroorotase [Rhodospirillaceae bacterium]MDP6405579.1 dihydroorotase [Alphaproteobacteria bacterium]MDP6624386.1 dihydroorotase [Alphaproteobacteria bacterium]
MNPAPAGRTLWQGARLLDAASGRDESGDLLVEDGLIADLGPNLFPDGPPEDTTLIDCGGHCLAPGLVDMRAFLGEPGFEHRETLASGSAAAASGGITTIAARPDTEPVIDDIALVEFVKSLAQATALVRVHPMAAITKGLKGSEMTELGLLAEAGAVAFCDGETAVADALVMSRVLAYATIWDLLIVQLPAEPRLAGSGCMNEGEVATRMGLSGVPAAAEVIMLERDLRLVEHSGGRYHATCLSTAAAIEAMRQAKARGLPVSCSVAPHHFALNENAVGEYRTFAKTWPPLRSEADRQAVVEGIADGTVDAIVSDHAPQDQESKRQPFTQAASGISGLETLLPLALELHLSGGVALDRVLAALSCGPAAVLGLEGGRLAPGAPADLVLFDLERPWRINEAQLLAKCKNTPFDGRPVQGLVLRTAVGGSTVYQAESDGGN